MMLFLCAQDLQFLWLGLMKDMNVVVLESHHVSPEKYLKELDRFFSKQHIQPRDLEGVCVVTGPGSFTSSRISLTIANTLHFVHGTALFVLVNPDHLTPAELLSKNGLGNQMKSIEYSYAFYDRAPHITKPRGDK